MTARRAFRGDHPAPQRQSRILSPLLQPHGIRETKDDDHDDDRDLWEISDTIWELALGCCYAAVPLITSSFDFETCSGCNNPGKAIRSL